MATLKLIQFSGEIPRLISRLLPDTAAARAENIRLDNGGLYPVRQARLEHTFAGPGPIATIYKFGTEWLYWATQVNAVPGPVATDRLYYTGDGVPKMRSRTDVYNLALAAPTAALTATASGVGSGDVITRLYVYTFVTDFGEESEPCPISNEVSWQSGQTVTLAGFQNPPSGRNITKQRIYRSQSSIVSGTDLFLIDERTASNSDYVDSIAPEDFAEVLPSLDWNPPPDDLEGLISLPNGMMAAFVGKDLYFCEPYRPHAWPEKYVLTMDYPIVALGAVGSAVVVMTTGIPYIVVGNAPESMDPERIEQNLPCINARGVVDLPIGVAYPSYDGLVLVNQNGAEVITRNLFTRDGWLKTSPATFVASQYSGRYFASYSYLKADGTPDAGTMILDLTGEAPFILRAARQSDACFYDLTTSSLFMLSDLEVYEWDALGQINEVMTWESKEFVLNQPADFGAILIESGGGLSIDEEAALEAEIAAIEAENAALFAMTSIGGEINGAAYNVYPVNGDALIQLPQDTFVTVRVFADGELRATITDTDTVVRLPEGKGKARRWQVLVNGTGSIDQISLATSVRELNAI